MGGRLIFRDLVYQMEPFFKADAEEYRSEGRLSYPNMDPLVRGRRLLFRLAAMTGRGRKYIYGNMPALKVAGLKKLVARA